MNQEEIDQNGMHVVPNVSREEAQAFADQWAYDNAYDENLRARMYTDGVEVAYLSGWIILAKQQGGLFGEDSVIAWAVPDEPES